MKSKFSFSFLIIVLMGLLSCKKKDEYPPKIYLKGDNPMRVSLEGWFKDPGAEADDNVDGPSITSKLVMTHNVPINGPANGEGPTKDIGDFTVTYTVKDNAGNEGKAERTVYVRNDAEFLVNSPVNTSLKYKYEVTIDAQSTNQPILKDTTGVILDLSLDRKKNRRFWFNKFALKNGFRVYADLKWNNNEKRYHIDIPSQEKAFNEKVGSNTVRYLYEVKGILENSYIVDSISPYFVIKYYIYRYYYNNNIGTHQWNDSLWDVKNQDVITEIWDYTY
ncbi:MAG: DUF5011 domain-containing protein [Bacteroidales bacterium]|nr:DUF5011 domain-containing protein [Bacteroidales bacterium]